MDAFWAFELFFSFNAKSAILPFYEVNFMTDYQKICDFENLYKAHKRARCCKRHKKDVILFEMNLAENLWNIKNFLENHTYKVAGYKKFMIFDPKEREIQAFSYYGRIVQHVLCDEVLTPFFDKRLIYDNCACRIGKSTHFALNRLTHFFHQHYKKFGSNGYILKCDIRKYFASIHHEVLKNRLKTVISDKDILNILFHIIDSFEHSPNRGLPMGNQASQLFDLYYLSPLDRFIKENLQKKHYVRYMDDLVLLSNDKDFLQDCLKDMRKIVNVRLMLDFNEKTQIFPIKNGVDFLGFHFYLTDSGKIVKKLRRSSKIRFKNRIKSLQKDYKSGKTQLENINMSLASYRGHLIHGHTYKLRTSAFSKFTFSKN